MEDHDGDVDPNPNHRCPCQGKTWGVRSLRFTPSSSLAGLDPYGDNRELLVFSEHQSTIHIVDARTFDTSPDSRQRLFLPDILQRYPKSSYIEQTTKTANAIQLDRRGKKRKRGELSDSDGDDAERKRRETADELVDNAEIVARPVSNQSLHMSWRDADYFIVAGCHRSISARSRRHSSTSAYIIA